MKENLLDVLMYLFENYFYDDVDLAPDEVSLHNQLTELGFPQDQVDKAFRWLEDLGRQREAGSVDTLSSQSLRVFTDREMRKLDVDSRGFLLHLEHNSILDSSHRELVIDRIMALGAETIRLEQVKWVVLMVLFNQPGQEAAFAWMHDLVYEAEPGHLH